MTRLEANHELLAILSNYLEKHPDIRFSQALMNCYFVKQEDRRPTISIYKDLIWRDEFYLESEVLLERVKEAMGIENDK